MDSVCLTSGLVKVIGEGHIVLYCPDLSVQTVFFQLFKGTQRRRMSHKHTLEKRAVYLATFNSNTDAFSVCHGYVCVCVFFVIFQSNCTIIFLLVQFLDNFTSPLIISNLCLKHQHCMPNLHAVQFTGCSWLVFSTLLFWSLFFTIASFFPAEPVLGCGVNM